MSLARRLMAGTAGVAPSANAGQVEYTEPGTYMLFFPEGVDTFSAVGIAAGLASSNTSPFTGRPAGNLHWRNAIPVPASRWVSIQIGVREGVTASAAKETWIKDGADYLVRASNSHGNAGQDYWDTLGGGGGRGGSGGSGTGGNGGLGGGGPGYAGKGGRGGNYHDTTSGQLPETDSGGGRGGDANGFPYGWSSSSGEGTGLLGRSADKTTSLGEKLFGYGIWGGPGPTASPGGLRIIWGDDRTYPDNVPDRAAEATSTFVSSANGAQNDASPIPFTFHVGAEEGDLLLFWIIIYTSGSLGSFNGISNMNREGNLYWKQITAADIAASLAGTVSMSGNGHRTWATAVYRGARMARQRGVMSSTTGALVMPGVTKRVDSQRLVLTIYDQDASASISIPTGFTSRVLRSNPINMRLSDISAADYVNGADIITTGLVNGGSALAYLIELY